MVNSIRTLGGREGASYATVTLSAKTADGVEFTVEEFRQRALTEVSVPLDNDGFLRRECPNCHREFKWHNGPANEEAERQPAAETFYCPLCGEPAGADSGWTAAQLDLIENATERYIGQELGDMFKGLENSSNSFLQIKVDTPDVPDASDPLVEPDDMMVVTSPCHAWEPIKVPESHEGAIPCLVCGSAFAV